jgi:hypothetical protein
MKGGFQNFATDNSEFNQLTFIIRQMINNIYTAALVRVSKIDAVKKRLTITPMVSQLDADRQAIPISPIYNVPYVTLQGGGSAVILTPQVGDIGIAVFAMRDISTVKTTGKESIPGSLRKYNPADAVYIGGVLNPAPQRTIEITDADIIITTNGAVKVNAPKVELGDSPTDPLLLSSKLIEAFNAHTHTGVQGGTGTSGTPASPITPEAVTSQVVKTL